MLPSVMSVNVKFEKNQLVISEETSLDEWKNLGYHLSNLQDNVQFWIGDWVKFGMKKGFYIGDVYDELEEITGLDRDTLKHYKSISDKVPTSARYEGLGFSHHAEVAKLNPTEQSYFLDKALQEKLSVRELRLQIVCKNPFEVPGKNISVYNNNSPFPIRFGELHLKLQEEAFEMGTTIHMRVMCIIRAYFENKLKSA